MALDAHPVRCDQHRTNMITVRLRYADIALETDGYRCAEPGCTRHYTDGRGYFDVIDNRVLAEKFQQRCPKCGNPMYFSEAEERGEIWRCPFSRCAHEQRMVS